MSKTYYKGEIYLENIPILSGNNSAFLYGQSVFTSSLVQNGNVLFFKEHLARVLHGAKELFDVTENEQTQLAKDIQKGSEILLKNCNEGDYFRITLFWDQEVKFILFSDVSMKRYPSIQAKTIKKVPRGEYIPEFVKVGSYVDENYLKKSVAKEGFNDVLFIHGTQVLEFSTGNVFFMKENTLITPLKYGIFPGIIRQKIIDLGKELNLEIFEKNVHINEIENFDYVFQTNSVKIMTPVDQIDQMKFKKNIELVSQIKEKLLG